jgi:hypothetical protein
MLTASVNITDIDHFYGYCQRKDSERDFSADFLYVGGYFSLMLVLRA